MMTKMRGFKTLVKLTAVAAAAAIVVGCGDDPAPAVVLPAGNVVQGPVSGATVFADRTDGGTRGALDADERAFSALTDSTGAFRITGTPTYAYELVSIGGTDTITNQPAITLRAEGGAAGSAVATNVLTPLTTLVALAPTAQRDALRATIRSLGVEPNQRIDQSITPAAAALVKSVTTMVNQVTEAIRLSTADDKLPTSATTAIQTQLVTALATNLSTAAAGSLTSAIGIAAVTQAATSSALDTLKNNASTAGGVTITVADAAAVATAVANSTKQVVDAVAAANNNALSAAPAAAKPEAQVVTQAVTSTINTQVDQGSVTASANVTSVAPTNNPPTITGATSASGAVDTAFTYTPTINDPDADDRPFLKVTVSGQKALPPGLQLIPATGVITGTPTAAGTGTYTLTVSDGRATASLTVTLTFTRPTGSTGATF